ncbi:UbiX family flavin prenyltransferase [Helicobacter apodemus]|uniref:3-octaprenyl-4-hydroxybenzoate carboxy-lyase n=1 Tax=Helicobacter apodemus TaxID=135569 RepID=A0A2U8FG77_9HELI|nr:UbiX family flavin prenyltransferase [Helicobacter apodemus]AWI34787.1 3-octaprenyl-4-hydroxybenzoate carboxy-lyase [Helicobacter apodemus]
MKRIIVGISGASAVNLGFRFLEILPLEIEKYCVISKRAKEVLKKENQAIPQEVPNTIYLEDLDLGACIASGSFICESMVVIPCSQNTLAKIAYGISDTLITRAASVMIKERRNLLLAPREMPFSTIALENMAKLSQIGIIIAPPIFGYYAGSSLKEIENLVLGKWCDILGIPYAYKRWGEGGLEESLKEQR